MDNVMSNDEIIDRILSRAKGKKGETIPVEHIMKSELGIWEPHSIRRILQIMQENEIGGKLFAGGALLWNEKARRICDEGYLNYVNRIKLEESEEKELKRIIKTNSLISTPINQTLIKGDKVIVGNISGNVKQVNNSIGSETKSEGLPKWAQWIAWIIGILMFLGTILLLFI